MHIIEAVEQRDREPNQASVVPEQARPRERVLEPKHLRERGGRGSGREAACGQPRRLDADRRKDQQPGERVVAEEDLAGAAEAPIQAGQREAQGRDLDLVDARRQPVHHLVREGKK